MGLEPEFPSHYGLHSRYIDCTIGTNEEQLILAAKLGDGYIAKGNKGSKACRISWNMGNKEHALHKAGSFEFLGSSYKEMDNPGFGDDWFCVVTKSHPSLNKYAEMSIKDCAAKLNHIGWAVYYGDDGHLCKKQGVSFIHTEGKTLDDVKSILKSLNKFIGFDGASIHTYIGGTKKRKMHCIRMKKDGSNEFMRKTAPYMESGVEYKNVYCNKN